MSFTRLVCLSIRNPTQYAIYREHMTPLLATYGGAFLIDISGATVLKNPAPFEVDRIFVMQFDDKSQSDAFFSDPKYVAIKEKYFEDAVAEIFVLAL